MTHRISDKRQEYILKRGDDFVLKVKAILGESFHKAAAMEVVELYQGNQYMVMERKGSTLNINLNMNWQTTEPEKVLMTKSEVGQQLQLRMKTNVLMVEE